MKDKRQKMTLNWPCGDPMMAAYVLQAAAASGQLPYQGTFSAVAAARCNLFFINSRLGYSLGRDQKFNLYT